MSEQNRLRGIAGAAPTMSDETFKQRATEENGQMISVCNLHKTLSEAIRDFATRANPDNTYKVPIAWIDWAESLERSAMSGNTSEGLRGVLDGLVTSWRAYANHVGGIATTPYHDGMRVCADELAAELEAALATPPQAPSGTTAEEYATVALVQRCESGTPWNLACDTIAEQIRLFGKQSRAEQERYLHSGPYGVDWAFPKTTAPPQAPSATSSADGEK